VAAFIGKNADIGRTLPRILYALCGIALFMLVVSQFNNMYYVFDEKNRYTEQEIFWLSQAVGIVCLTVVMAFVLRHRKSMHGSDVYFLLSYAFIPILAMAVQTILYQSFEFLYIATTFSILASYGGIQARQEKLLKDMELKLSQGRIMTMLSQIQPHFLYNSLAVIQRLCVKDPKLAEETVVEFTRYLRGNIDSLSCATLIPFEKELGHVQNYLALEKKRFGTRLHIVYDIAVRNFRLPALTVQPIAENAVRHGLTKREEGGTLTILTSENAREIIITVRDDGVGFDPNMEKRDGRQHVGMENVRCRLASMCGGTLVVQSEPGVGTTAVITIPKAEGLHDEYYSGR